MKVKNPLKPLAILCTLLCSNAALAEQYEISVMVGQMYGSDLVANDDSDINVDSGSNISIGLAWQENVNGLGQILLNRVSHDFTDQNETKNTLDITYAHFNGVALFRQQKYVTTMSLGFGGAYFDAEQGSDELYPSASIAFGTRYEFSERVALVTELRAYATLIDEDDAIFCLQDICGANFTDSLWIDSSITVGIAVKF
ncbi:hypothetical protein [Cognaticolwellia beringensis]|uniref:Outer membrane protein beta-barrel domain-containing protein n=1 Tax=Cognaticolwellia beringensis TaxID=1967665 RepID=A0A222G545_9GAMM|nr:hypothetical protein [Cognaticolwellia beringensis]ASP46494.1 hypothetical protein B5D82_01115 [Cognaticolwellia beringensis]